MATCTSCGAKLRPGEKFCLECGSAVEEAVLKEMENSPPEPEEQKPAPKVAETAPKAAETGGGSINIVRPKDISVLKEAPEPVAVKKPSKPAPTPPPKPDNDLPPIHKRVIPDVELPEDDRYFKPQYSEGDSLPVAQHMMNKREDDFTKGFYSDSSVAGKHAQTAVPKPASIPPMAYREAPPPKKKMSPVPIVIILAVIAAVVFWAYYYGFLDGLLGK